jgi:hypothetical protein
MAQGGRGGDFITPELDEAGYRQTESKLADLVDRRSCIVACTDLRSTHREEVVRSYDRMIRQYRREIKLYEAAHGTAPEAAEK